MGGTLSIEIVKDNELHKVYFRCRDKVSICSLMESNGLL